MVYLLDLFSIATQKWTNGYLTKHEYEYIGLFLKSAVLQDLEMQSIGAWVILTIEDQFIANKNINIEVEVIPLTILAFHYLKTPPNLLSEYLQSQCELLHYLFFRRNPSAGRQGRIYYKCRSGHRL